MKYWDDKVEDIKVAYIGGGSRGWAWGFMTDLAKEPALSGAVYLYDIDKDAAKVNETIGNSLKGREDVVGKWDYKAVDTMEEALSGADFVVISILPKKWMYICRKGLASISPWEILQVPVA